MSVPKVMRVGGHVITAEERTLIRPTRRLLNTMRERNIELAPNSFFGVTPSSLKRLERHGITLPPEKTVIVERKTPGKAPAQEQKPAAAKPEIARAKMQWFTDAASWNITLPKPHILTGEQASRLSSIGFDLSDCVITSATAENVFAAKAPAPLAEPPAISAKPIEQTRAPEYAPQAFARILPLKDWAYSFEGGIKTSLD